MPLASPRPSRVGRPGRWRLREYVAQHGGLLRGASLAILAVLLLLLARRLPSAEVPDSARRGIEQLGVLEPVALGGLYVVATLLMIPGWVLTLAAGALYGLVLGTVVVSLASTTAAALAFLLARYWLRQRVQQWLARSARLAAVDQAIGQQGWKIVALLRLSPAVPFNVQNYLYGVTAIRFWPCVLVSWVTMLPGTFLYVYLGALGRKIGTGTPAHPAQRVLEGVGLLATVLVTVYVARLARQALRQQTSLESLQDAPLPQPAASPERRPVGVSAPQHTSFPADPLAWPQVQPLDGHNQNLLASVHPPDWVNPTPSGRYNLVVIGAGTAGLVAAAGAAALGAKVALIERLLLGGDCLNIGCVPSKALLRAARAAADVRRAGQFGVRVPAGTWVDFSAVMERLRALRAELSPHDSAARFRDLGVDVFFGQATFTGPDTVEVDGQTLRFARACLATGARAAVPPIPGLKEAGFLTNETVFSLSALPRRLAVIGAGPIGCELAQAFARLGSQVSLIEATHGVLPRDERPAAEIVQRALAHDGVELLCCGENLRVEATAAGKRLRVDAHGVHHDLTVDEILVAAGRVPNVEGMGLEAACVAYGREGVTVNDFLQTSNPRIYAAGDVCSPFKFTHAADAMARVVIHNALFFGWKRASALTIPWCTYTDPEVAHVGLTLREADERGIPRDTLAVELSQVDRAVLDGDRDGLLLVHLRRGTDQILGATLVARHAGEMISEITLAMTAGAGWKTLSRVLHPYPTQAEIIKKAADAYHRRRLTPRAKRLLAALLSWRR